MVDIAGIKAPREVRARFFRTAAFFSVRDPQTDTNSDAAAPLTRVFNDTAINLSFCVRHTAVPRLMRLADKRLLDYSLVQTPPGAYSYSSSVAA